MLKTLLNELGNTTEQLMRLCALGAIESIEKSALWGITAYVILDWCFGKDEVGSSNLPSSSIRWQQF